MGNTLKSMQEFPLRMGALPQGALQYAAFMDAEPADAAEVAELAGWLFGKGQFPVLDGVDTELLGIEVRCTLLTACISSEDRFEKAQHTSCCTRQLAAIWMQFLFRLHDTLVHASHRFSVLLSHPQ